MNGGGGGQRVVRFRVYFAGPAHSTGRCAWPLRFPLAGRRHVNFISIATHLGAVSFLPPHLEAFSHFQPGHGAMSSVTWRQKGTQTRNGTQRPGLRLRENLALFPAPVRSSTHFAEGRVKAAGCRLFLARGLGLELRPLPAAWWELRLRRP